MVEAEATETISSPCLLLSETVACLPCRRYESISSLGGTPQEQLPKTIRTPKVCDLNLYNHASCIDLHRCFAHNLQQFLCSRNILIINGLQRHQKGYKQDRYRNHYIMGCLASFFGFSQRAQREPRSTQRRFLARVAKVQGFCGSCSGSYRSGDFQSPCCRHRALPCFQK